VFHILIWGVLELCLGEVSPPKPPRGDGTGHKHWQKIMSDSLVSMFQQLIFCTFRMSTMFFASLLPHHRRSIASADKTSVKFCAPGNL